MSTRKIVRRPSIDYASDRTFNSMLARSRTPLLLDFTAKWCGPCREMKPTLVEVARRFAGRLKVVEIDIERNPGLVDRFAIGCVPALLLRLDARREVVLIGYQALPALIAWVARHLGATDQQAKALAAVDSTKKTRRRREIQLHDGPFHAPPGRKLHFDTRIVAVRASGSTGDDGEWDTGGDDDDRADG